MQDIHSHILFGVDDGSRDLAESRKMLKAAHEVGFEKIVCTPHFHSSRFDIDLIESNFEKLAAHAARQGIEMLLGFEVYWRTLMEAGSEIAPELCIDDSNLLLLEFSYDPLPLRWERIVFELQAMGLEVIIAHPERYAPIQRDIRLAEQMKRMGCLLQLSANFIGGGLLSPSRRTAIALMEHGFVDYIASDAHCVEDYRYYPKAMNLWKRKRPD